MGGPVECAPRRPGRSRDVGQSASWPLPCPRRPPGRIGRTRRRTRTPRAGASDAILRVRGLSKTFRGLTALSEYDLDLPAGRIHGVIGPNGAGKTTLFHVLSGFLRPSSGSIAFEGQEIAGWPSYKVARLGIARTFQNIRLFGDETALDNVIVGLQAHAPRSLIGTIFSSRGFRAGERELEERATSCSTCSGSPPSATGWPATSRTATSAGWRSPGPSRAGRGSSCSTSRTPA